MRNSKVFSRGLKFILTLPVAFQSIQALAHHSFVAEFDSKQHVQVRGKVVKVELVNPHAWIWINVKVPGKPDQLWMFETGSPNKLLRNGVTKDTLKIGSEVDVRGYQSHDRSCNPACKANGRTVSLPNGKKAFVGTVKRGAPDDDFPESLP